MDHKNGSLYYLKICMSVINFVILAFFSIVTSYTIYYINQNFSARDFLENVTYLPMESVKMAIITFLAFFFLLLIIEVRGKERKNTVLSLIVYGMEILLCLVIIRCLYISYNGIILLVVADIVTSIRDKHNRALFLAIMGFIYILSDYSIVSIQFKVISFQEFLNVYNSKISMLLMGAKNMLVSINIFVFIVYMIILMRNQMKENARIALLNIQLQTANARLKEMNVQLQDYAQMQKKMGETEERNRIAREIHDTLGHTMTGLSAGIDACIAMIDFSVDATKKQLNKISKVARQGINDIRRSVNKLRPDALEHLNLEAALEKMMEETMEVSDVSIYYHCDLPVLKFNQDEEDMIYRVVQEGITNAIRHGNASNIEINIQKENKWLILSIQDDGIGCDEIQSGFGLIHIKERIQMLNGEVKYDGSHGFHITAKIPIRWGKIMIKVLIADDQELIRQSLQIVLETREGISVIGTAKDGREVIQMLRKEKPDVILMDVRMPEMDGVACTKIIKDAYPEIKIIILTTFDDDEFVFSALKHGASGYLLKGISMDELEKAIHTVCKGGAMINPEIATKVVELFSEMAQGNYDIMIEAQNVEELTDTEWEIIKLVGRGMSNKEISAAMNLSEGTVRNYLSTILNKLNLRDRTQLAIWEVQSGSGKYRRK